MPRSLASAVALLALAGLPPTPAPSQVRVGTEFQVNAYTTGDQRGASVAVDAAGNFVVVWRDGFDTGQDGSQSGVFGHRFDAAGVPQGTEFQVNSYTTGLQNAPRVALDAFGNFVVVWESFDGQRPPSVFGQRYDAGGTPQGSEFRVNDYTTTSSQYIHSVASDASGNFVIVWQGCWPGCSGVDVLGRRFDAMGAPIGGEFRVNSYTTGSQGASVVASDASGNFVVMWGSDHIGGGVDIFAQRYDASGKAQGIEFLVNAYTIGDQRGQKSVAFNTVGAFVMAWTSVDQDGSGTGVFGQGFDPDGIRLGDEFRINAYTTGSQGVLAVVSDGSGGFVVLWGGPGPDGNGIFGQRFDVYGAPQAVEFRAIQPTTGGAGVVSAASDADGDFLVVWNDSAGRDGSGAGIFAQRFAQDLIFGDRFESGSAVP